MKCTDKILFLAEYPNERNIADGMIQRIKAIDEQFEACPRVYLSVLSRRRFFKSSKTRVNDRLEIIHANLFTGIFLIMKTVLSSKNVYIHSLYNYKWVFPFISKRKCVVLDLHGVVPQELDFMGRKFQARIFSWLEKRIFGILSGAIFVSDRMKDYYIDRYSISEDKKLIILPIIPRNALIKVGRGEEDELRKRLSISARDVVFIYSGNLQKWQNFELMLDKINELNNPGYKFIILTGDVGGAEALIEKKGLDRTKITLTRVLPSEIGEYYSISHYGFILRDDHILNEVAAPTKLVEYMFYGLVPIVKSVKLGDAPAYGFEYIDIESLNDSMTAIKSDKNRMVAARIIKRGDGVDLKDMFV